jgi:DHA2 family multidrug resistance protein
MQVLDGTIANVSIPTIAGNLGVSTSQGTWVITSFAVANGVSVPLTGWLMGRYGVVKVFIMSVLLFTFASFLCGISWNLPSLILFRIMQGGLSGPLIPGSQALLLMIFPPNKRGTALAIWSMTTLVAPVFGPILGGYISDNLSWEWIFLINVPVGLICAAVSWRGLKSRETPTRRAPIDRTGFVLLLVWVGALQIMLDTGKDADWFSSPAIWVLCIVALVGCVAWVIWELNEEHPIVDLSLFRSRNFTVGIIVTCIAYSVFYGNSVLLPLWLQTQMGYVATWAGLVAAPGAVIAVLLTPILSPLMNRIDARLTASAGFASFAIGFYMRSQYTSQIDVMALVMPMLVQGLGLSTFFIAMVTIALNGVSQRQTPAASGLYNFARITASSFAASIATTVWDRIESVQQTRIVETMTVGGPGWNQATAALRAAGMSTAQVAGAVGQQIVNQSYLLSTIEIFRVSAWLMALMVPLIWLAKKVIPNARTVPAAD